MTIEDRIKPAKERILKHIPDFDFTTFYRLVDTYDAELSVRHAFHLASISTGGESTVRLLIDIYLSEEYSRMTDRMIVSIPEDAPQEVRTIVRETKDEAVVKEAMNLALTFPPENSVGILRVIGSVAVTANDAVQDCVELIRSYQDQPQIGRLIAYYVGGVAAFGQDSESTKIVIDKYGSDKFRNLMDRDSFKLMACRVADITHMRVNEELTQAFIDFCSLSPFQSHVYDELAKYLMECDVKRQDVSRTIHTNQQFLVQQSSQTVFPLLAILCEVEEIYHSKIQELDENDKILLTQAYSIARSNNDDGGNNYLPQFYAGVKGMLDTRPDKLGAWARSVCDDFRKQGEKGLLRWVG